MDPNFSQTPHRIIITQPSLALIFYFLFYFKKKEKENKHHCIWETHYIIWKLIVIFCVTMHIYYQAIEATCVAIWEASNMWNPKIVTTHHSSHNILWMNESPKKYFLHILPIVLATRRTYVESNSNMEGQKTQQC